MAKYIDEQIGDYYFDLVKSTIDGFFDTEGVTKELMFDPLFIKTKPLLCLPAFVEKGTRYTDIIEAVKRVSKYINVAEVVYTAFATSGNEYVYSREDLVTKLKEQRNVSLLLCNESLFDEIFNEIDKKSFFYFRDNKLMFNDA